MTIITICFLFTPISFGEQLTISYVNHPRVIDKYLPIVKQAYSNIGLSPNFVKMTPSRGLKSLKTGFIDGDVIRMERHIDSESNLISVPPILTKVTTYLICSVEVECNLSVLSDKEKVVLVNIASVDELLSQLNIDIKATLYQLENIGVFTQLLNTKRFQYMIYPFESNEIPKELSNDFNYLKLIESNSFHVILKKHSHLIPRLSIEIKKGLADSENINNKKGDS